MENQLLQETILKLNISQQLLFSSQYRIVLSSIQCETVTLSAAPKNLKISFSTTSIHIHAFQTLEQKKVWNKET